MKTGVFYAGSILKTALVDAQESDQALLLVVDDLEGQRAKFSLALR